MKSTKIKIKLKIFINFFLHQEDKEKRYETLFVMV